MMNGLVFYKQHSFNIQYTIHELENYFVPLRRWRDERDKRSAERGRESD